MMGLSDEMDLSGLFSLKITRNTMRGKIKEARIGTFSK